MQTQLIEFKSNSEEILRGILTVPENPSDRLTVMAAGFERSAASEKKFKVLADELAKIGMPSMRFDYTGVGLSDGEFMGITVARMADEIKRAMAAAKEATGAKAVNIAAHSLSACPVAVLSQENIFNRIVLIAPALNQRELGRYFFVLESMKNLGSDLNVSWGNYRAYLNEESYLAEIKKEGRMTKKNFLSPEYYLENLDKDYGEILAVTDNMLCVHGEADAIVPLESINAVFKNKIIVPDGDHNLERPDMMGEWMGKAVQFINENPRFDLE